MKRKPKQLTLAVRNYIVRADGFGDSEVQARSAAGAKYAVFKNAQDAGYFTDRKTGFRDFLNRGFRAIEVRR